MTDEIKEFIKVNNEKHKNIIDSIDLLKKEIKVATTITNFSKWAAGIFLTIIVVLLSVMASNSIRDKNMATKMLDIQQQALTVQYSYIVKLDSLSKHLKLHDRVYADILDTVTSINVTIRKFYYDEYTPDRIETWKLYNNELHPTTIRSKKNEQNINRISQKLKKVGIYDE